MQQCSSVAFRRKSLKRNIGLTTKLDRCLTTSHLVFYGLSAMAGLGIYVLTGHIIKDRAGPATNISMVLSGLICIFSAMCYCEFSTLIPKAGSCYTYTYILIGELPAYLIGWTTILDILISTASITKGFSGTIDLMCNNALMNFTTTYLPLMNDSTVIDSSFDICGVGLIIILLAISISGANISLSVNSWLFSIQFCFLLTMIIGCFVYGKADNITADGGYLPFGVIGIFKGAGIATFAFSGFENVANAAEETKNPNKSIKIALFTSLGIVIIIYFFASTGLSFLVPRLLLNQKSPFVAGFDRLNNVPFKYISSIAVLMATGANKISSFYLYPRIFYALASDGLIFKFLGSINETTKAPLIALLSGGVIIIILTGFIKIQVLADMTTMGLLASYAVIGVDLLILRYIYKDEDDNEYEKSKAVDKLPMRVAFMSRFLPYRSTFIGLIWGFLLCIIFGGISAVFILPKFLLVGSFLCTIFGVLAILIMVLFCLYRPNEMNPTFSTPLMPITPLITISMNIFLIINLPWETWVRCLIWTIVGLLIYLSYGVWHSKLRYTSDYDQLSEDTVSEMDESTRLKTLISPNDKIPSYSSDLEQDSNH